MRIPLILVPLLGLRIDLVVGLARPQLPPTEAKTLTVPGEAVEETPAAPVAAGRHLHVVRAA